MNPQDYMREALHQAELAMLMGEVPVGAVIVYDGKIIARAHNRCEIENDATQHAEILAIRHAAKVLGNFRLENCTLYVTLEPCPMCTGAIALSRISRVIYGCSDIVAGAMGGKIDLLPSLTHQPEVFGGLMADECALLLKTFFSEKR